MKKRHNLTVRFLVPAILALLMYVLGPLQADPMPQGARRGRDRLLSKMILPGTQDLQLIIQLSSPGAIEWMRPRERQANVRNQAALNEQPRLDVQSVEARSYRSRLVGEQGRLIQSLAALRGVQVQRTIDTVMNAVIARVPAEHYNRIVRLPGVKKVYFSRPQKLLLDASANLVNAAGLWNKAGGNAQAGRGIKIGMIDTGIDITNPMLIDSSLVAPPGFPKGEPAFTNSKVIVARNYLSLLSSPQAVNTATDESGHGTFTAAEAAGKQVQAPAATISGMAPGAFLGNYKVFGTPGINSGTTTAAVIAAVEDAIKDGMDVISLSLGSLDWLPPADDPEQSALQDAINAGRVVVIAAGNDGPDTHTISNPGGMPDAITVGAVSNSRTLVSMLHVTAPAPVPANLVNVPYIPGTGPVISAAVPATPVVDVQSFDGTGLGCSAFSASTLSGRIAFIQRGTCTFLVKVTNATAAGATAVVVYNNEPGADAIVMGNLETTTIPAVMVSNGDGLALKGFLSTQPGAVRAKIDNFQTLSTLPTPARLLSSFSAKGPAPDFGLKPDLVAVGESVYSATEGTIPSGDLFNSSKFTISDGTSFSTPMVAGAAAGLKQLFSGLGPLAIRSLLTSTASRNLTVDGVNAPSVIQAGNGLLNMGSAASAGAVFSPTNLNFGVHSYAGSFSSTQTLTMKNIGSVPDQYSLSLEQQVSGPALSLSQTSTATVSPGATTNVNLNLQIAAPLSGGFQGFVTVRSTATSFTYRIPYWAGLYVPDSSRILQVSRSSSGGNVFDSINAALAAARPGNIIEITDSSTYTGAVTITTNAEGLPLHGLTIRAAAGQTPTIDGTGLGSLQTVWIAGLQNVLLQGLTINGGSIGIELQQPSPSVPLSATVDHCNITNVADAGSNSSAIEIDGGGTLNVTKSTITGSSGDAIFVSTPGSYLTVFASTITNNGLDGIDARGSNVQVLHSTVSNNLGAGLFLDTCTGTIDGNTFSGNQPVPGLVPGDGADIAGGNLTITNNVFDGNDAVGLWLGPSSDTLGAVASLSGNTVSHNKDSGFYAEAGQNLRFDGNIVKDNGNGVYLSGTETTLLLNNIIVRSTGPSAGHPSDSIGDATGNGVEAAGPGSIQLVNNSIYGSVHNGISVSGTAAVTVYNTIVDANQGGELQGIASGSLKSSLVGIDPKFTNPNADDFSLQPGSPALDAGSNNAPGLTFLDYSRRLRVRGSGGVVDIGAVETNSAFPLVFPLMANGVQASLQNNVTTGIAVLNSGTTGSVANFGAYDSAGVLLAGSSNPTTQTIGPAAQVATLGWQLFGFGQTSPTIGGMLTDSPSQMAGFFLIFDADFRRFANGANVSDQAGTDMLFMRHESDASGSATYALFNPGVNPANVTATVITEGGTAVAAPKTATVVPKGQFVFGFNNVTQSSGYVRIASDRPVSGIELYGNTDRLAVLAGVRPGSEARLFFPHVAFNQGYTSTIGAINTGDLEANLVLTAYQNDGQPMAAPVSIQLDSKAQLLKDAAALFGIPGGALATGYIVAQSDQPGIQGFTAFRFDDGVHKSEAAVPVESVPRQRLLFSHIAHQVSSGSSSPYETGVALLNPFGTTVSYTLSVFDDSGKLVAQKSDSLGPAQKVAKLLSHPLAGVGFFTQPLPLSSGHIEVTSDYGLFGFELFFTEDQSQLASVPAQ